MSLVGTVDKPGPPIVEVYLNDESTTDFLTGEPKKIRVAPKVSILHVRMCWNDQASHFMGVITHKPLLIH